MAFINNKVTQTKDAEFSNVRLARWLIRLSAVLFINIGAVYSTQAVENQNVLLSLSDAITQAQVNDPWLRHNRHMQTALELQSSASDALPDPVISLGLANLPTDGFDFNQEPMSQLKIGFSQMMPRGDSLKLEQERLLILSRQYLYLRADRQASIAVTVGHLWLDLYQAQQSIRLIEDNRSLFTQLADLAEASYSSAIGRTRQQDIIRAQLELTRLEDRLTRLRQLKAVRWQQISEWLSPEFISFANADDWSLFGNSHEVNLPDRLPGVTLINQSLLSLSQQKLIEHFATHPAVLALEQKVQASITQVNLARQQFEPAWGISASYGYRDKDPLNTSRADFLSVGVTFEIPLFTRDKRDVQVAASVSESAAIKTQRWQLLRAMVSGFNSARTKLEHLKQRANLFRLQLLPQIHQQAEAALTAYTNDEGEFSEVVVARISELNAEIDALVIDVDNLKTKIQMNYYLRQPEVELEQFNKHSGVGQ